MTTATRFSRRNVTLATPAIAGAVVLATLGLGATPAQAVPATSTYAITTIGLSTVTSPLLGTKGGGKLASYGDYVYVIGKSTEYDYYANPQNFDYVLTAINAGSGSIAGTTLLRPGVAEGGPAVEGNYNGPLVVTPSGSALLIGHDGNWISNASTMTVVTKSSSTGWFDTAPTSSAGLLGGPVSSTYSPMSVALGTGRVESYVAVGSELAWGTEQYVVKTENHGAPGPAPAPYQFAAGASTLLGWKTSCEPNSGQPLYASSWAADATNLYVTGYNTKLLKYSLASPEALDSPFDCTPRGSGSMATQLTLPSGGERSIGMANGRLFVATSTQVVRLSADGTSFDSTVTPTGITEIIPGSLMVRGSRVYVTGTDVNSNPYLVTIDADSGAEISTQALPAGAAYRSGAVNGSKLYIPVQNAGSSDMSILAVDVSTGESGSGGGGGGGGGGGSSDVVTPTPTPTPTPTATPTPTSTATASVTPTVTASASPSPTVTAPAGVVLLSGTERASAQVVTVTAPVSTSVASAPEVTVTTGTAVSPVVSGLPPSTPLQAGMSVSPLTRAKTSFVSIGTTRSTANGRAKVPAFKASRAGIYTIRLTTPAGKAFYLKVKVAPKKSSSASGSSAKASGKSSR